VMATRDTVKRVMTLLAETRPGTDLAKIGLDAYVLVLEQVPDDKLTEAAVLLAREPGDFLPSAGTLFDRALDLMDQEPPAEDAWALVERKARGKAVDLPERAAAVLANLGNWQDWTVDDLPFRKREFMDLYDKQRARWKRERALALPAGDVGGRLLSG
jgi:hypothetical protein